MMERFNPSKLQQETIVLSDVSRIFGELRNEDFQFYLMVFNLGDEVLHRLEL
jgi:hypothetical protein